MRDWRITNTDFFQKFKEAINNKYKTLHILIEDDTVYIRGTLFLDSADGRELDHYSIEIQIPHNFPKGLPIVREIGGRLPKITDRHFNPVDETACLFLPDERYKYYPEGSTIVDFIEGPVRSFLYWQSDYDLNKGKSSFGERGHADKGIIEFYAEEIGISDKAVIIKLLDYLTKKKVKGHWNCYCGSGKQLRYCHFDKLKDLRKKILRDDALKSLERIKSTKM